MEKRKAYLRRLSEKRRHGSDTLTLEELSGKLGVRKSALKRSMLTYDPAGRVTLLNSGTPRLPPCMPSLPFKVRTGVKPVSDARLDKDPAESKAEDPGATPNVATRSEDTISDSVIKPTYGVRLEMRGTVYDGPDFRLNPIYSRKSALISMRQYNSMRRTQSRPRPVRTETMVTQVAESEEDNSEHEKNVSAALVGLDSTRSKETAADVSFYPVASNNSLLMRGYTQSTHKYNSVHQFLDLTYGKHNVSFVHVSRDPSETDTLEFSSGRNVSGRRHASVAPSRSPGRTADKWRGIAPRRARCGLGLSPARLPPPPLGETCGHGIFPDIAMAQ